MSARAAVVLRTLNEARHIGAVLDAVLAQDEPAEVLVIDSGSSDGTLDEVGKRPAVRLHRIRREQFSFGGACNLGVELTDTPLVAFLSGHARPLSADWLRRLLEPFADPGVAGAFGRQLPLPEQDPVTAWRQLQAWSETPSVSTTDPRFSNANGAVRRADWEAAGFDPSLPGAEDVAWARQQQALGRAIAYAPDAAVEHGHRETLRQVYRRHQREGAGITGSARAPIPLGAALRRWYGLSREDAARLLRERRPLWAGYAVLHYAARVGGEWRGAAR
jgi:glycosyltransferase involved in cell wall biosynthesis